MSGIIGEFKSIPSVELLAKHDELSRAPRYYELRHGDVIFVNSIGFEKCFGMKIKDINLCDQNFDPNFICLKKVRRKKWWQFWKSKYVGVRLMYVDHNMEELKNEKERTEDDFKCNN